MCPTLATLISLEAQMPRIASVAQLVEQPSCKRQVGVRVLPVGTTRNPGARTMTDQEREAVRELVYISNEIAQAMARHPDMTALQIAGSFNDEQEEAARFARAIEAVGKLVYPAWGHHRSDEQP